MSLPFNQNPITGFQTPIELPSLHLIIHIPKINIDDLETISKYSSIVPGLIRNIFKNLSNIQKILTTDEDYLNIFIDLLIIPQNKKCHLKHQMNIIKIRNSFLWECSSCQDKNRNSFRISIRKDTIFEGITISFEKLFCFIKLFVLKIKSEVYLNQLGLDKNIIYKLKKRFYNLIFVMKEVGHNKIGGVNIIVEIDESFTVKRKYDRGRERLEVIIIGGIETNTQRRKKVFELIADRSEESMISFITRNIRKGSIIVSDEHKSYQNIAKLSGYDFKKSSVNHSKCIFVNQVTGATTNSIESNWNVIKLDKKNECGWRSTNINKKLSYLEILGNLDTNHPELDLLVKINNIFPASNMLDDDNSINLQNFFSLEKEGKFDSTKIYFYDLNHVSPVERISLLNELNVYYNIRVGYRFESVKLRRELKVINNEIVDLNLSLDPIDAEELFDLEEKFKVIVAHLKNNTSKINKQDKNIKTLRKSILLKSGLVKNIATKDKDLDKGVKVDYNNFIVTPFKKIRISSNDGQFDKPIIPLVWYLPRTIKKLLLRFSPFFKNEILFPNPNHEKKNILTSNRLKGSVISLYIKQKLFVGLLVPCNGPLSNRGLPLCIDLNINLFDSNQDYIIDGHSLNGIIRISDTFHAQKPYNNQNIKKIILIKIENSSFYSIIVQICTKSIFPPLFCSIEAVLMESK